MNVEHFQQAAETYERWFETPRGRQSARAEYRLLERLLLPLPAAGTVLEVGCGTGHFTGLLAESGFEVFGLDLVPAMLARARSSFPTLPFVRADAYRLPFCTRSFDAVVYITTVEFLEYPLAAMQEGVRVARRTVAAIVLNRYSVGGFSRRWGRQRRGRLLGTANDFSLGELRRLAKAAAGPRLGRVRWSSTLFPDGFRAARARIPVGGDVLGIGIEMQELPTS